MYKSKFSIKQCVVRSFSEKKDPSEYPLRQMGNLFFAHDWKAISKIFCNSKEWNFDEEEADETTEHLKNPI